MKKPYSMFLDKETFSVHTATHGSGYEGIHIQVKNWVYPDGKPEIILISRDALNPDEFDLHINELKSLLDNLRVAGHRELAKIKKRENAKRNETV